MLKSTWNWREHPTPEDRGVVVERRQSSGQKPAREWGVFARVAHAWRLLLMPCCCHAGTCTCASGARITVSCAQPAEGALRRSSVYTSEGEQGHVCADYLIQDWLDRFISSAATTVAAIPCLHTNILCALLTRSPSPSRPGTVPEVCPVGFACDLFPLDFLGTRQVRHIWMANVARNHRSTRRFKPRRRLASR